MVRKSTASAVSVDDAAPAAIPPTTTTTTTTTSTNTPTPTPKAAPKEKDDGLNIEDLNLPKSIVQRLAKGVLPPNTQIQKDALLAMSKGATVFVNYLTSYAAENAQRGGKKTVMPQDVYAAMKELEFEFMLPRLEAEVTKFTSIQADKRNTYRKKVRDEKKAAKDPQAPNDTGAAAEDSPPTKRARRSSADNGEHHSGSDDEVEGDETVDVEDEEVEDDDVDVEDEVPEEGLTEDLLEEPATRDEDDDMGDGDESD